MRAFIIEKLKTLAVKNEEKLIEYVDFCINNNKISHIKRQTENHHILLKSIFDEYSDLSEFVWNSTHLTYEDHYIAHSLLAEAVNHNSVIYAWRNMNSQNNKINLGEDIVGSERYSALRKLHYDIVSQLPHLTNRSKETIQKRNDTMSVPDENGVTEFQRNGQKISKSLKESDNLKTIFLHGEGNFMYNKITVKERLNPINRINVPTGYDNVKYIHHKINYLELIDNTGIVYFRGWKDECVDYCNSIGLDGSKISEKHKIAFNYIDNDTQRKYLIRVMKLANLGRYLNSTVRILTDQEAMIYIKNKEVLSNESKD